MQLHAWIESINARVPDGAPAGTRLRADTTVGAGPQAHGIAVEVLVDRQGRRCERFWCDGLRLQRHELLRLTCPEGECPQARALRTQWQDFARRRSGRPGPAAGLNRPSGPHAPAGALPMVQEHVLQVAGQSCAARPAVFRCFVRCPHGVHPPLWIDKQGFDLFEDGVCVGGGVVPATDLPAVRDAAGQPQPMLRPRLPTLPSARAWLAARAIEAAAAVALVAERR